MRRDTPLAIRLVVAAVAFAVAILAALTVPAALGPLTRLRLALTYVLIAAGFGLVAAVLSPAAARLRLQIVTGTALAAAATVLLQMEATVGSAARASGSEASLALTVALAAIVLATARFAARPFGFAVIIGLGVKGLAALVAAFVMTPPGPLSAGAQFPVVWNGLWIIGSIVAVWFGRRQLSTLPTSSARAA